MQRNVEAGVVREVDAQFISFILLGVGEAAGYWRMIHSEYSIEETTEKILDFITKGLSSTAFGNQSAGKAESSNITIVDRNDNAFACQGRQDKW